MLDELKEEQIVNKVGGRFKLSTLIQKRLVAPERWGASPRAARFRKSARNRRPGDHSRQDLSRHARCAAHDRRAHGNRRPARARSYQSMSPMNGRELLVGVSGGIAAYKSAALVSQLVQAGAGVSVVMTAAATKFIGAATFEALTGRPVPRGVFDESDHPLGAHIDLAEKGQLLCVAPATANFLAKAAGGLADDLLTTLVLAFSGPIVIAPAMNCEMWERGGRPTKSQTAPRRWLSIGRTRGGMAQLSTSWAGGACPKQRRFFKPSPDRFPAARNRKETVVDVSMPAEPAAAPERQATWPIF